MADSDTTTPSLTDRVTGLLAPVGKFITDDLPKLYQQLNVRDRLLGFSAGIGNHNALALLQMEKADRQMPRMIQIPGQPLMKLDASGHLVPVLTDEGNTVPVPARPTPIPRMIQIPGQPLLEESNTGQVDLAPTASRTPMMVPPRMPRMIQIPGQPLLEESNTGQVDLAPTASRTPMMVPPRMPRMIQIPGQPLLEESNTGQVDLAPTASGTPMMVPPRTGASPEQKKADAAAKHEQSRAEKQHDTQWTALRSQVAQLDKGIRGSWAAKNFPASLTGYTEQSIKDRVEREALPFVKRYGLHPDDGTPVTLQNPYLYKDETGAWRSWPVIDPAVLQDMQSRGVQ